MNRLMLLAPFALAACNSQPTVTATNASVAEVAKKVEAANADRQFVSPGRWQSTMTINEMKMPGMPPEFAEQMKAHMGKAKTFETCLTPEEAKRPKGDFFGAQKGCIYDRFTMGAGKIDAAMTCTAGGAKRTMTMSGTYAPDSYRMTVASEATGGGTGPDAMSMNMTLDAKRTGACTGKEQG